MKEKENFELNYDSIVELDEESINALYTDLVESGDDTRVVSCCRCRSGAANYTFKFYADSCVRWCSSQGSVCSFYRYSGSGCSFSC